MTDTPAAPAITDERLREYLRLEATATPGPWHVVSGDDTYCSRIGGVISDAEKQRIEADDTKHRGDFPETTRWIMVDPGCAPVVIDGSNEDFIATSRTIGPAAARELLDARGEVRRLREALSWYVANRDFGQHASAALAASPAPAADERDDLKFGHQTFQDLLDERDALRDENARLAEQVRAVKEWCEGQACPDVFTGMRPSEIWKAVAERLSTALAASTGAGREGDAP